MGASVCVWAYFTVGELVIQVYELFLIKSEKQNSNIPAFVHLSLKNISSGFETRQKMLALKTQWSAPMTAQYPTPPLGQYPKSALTHGDYNVLFGKPSSASLE